MEQMKEVKAIEVVENFNGDISIKNMQDVDACINKVMTFVKKVDVKTIDAHGDNLVMYKDHVTEVKDIIVKVEDAKAKILPAEVLAMDKKLDGLITDMKAHNSTIVKAVKVYRETLLEDTKNNAFKLIDTTNKFAIARHEFIAQCHELIKNIKIKENMIKKATEFAEQKNAEATAQLDAMVNIQNKIKEVFASNDEQVADSYVESKTALFLAKCYDMETVQSLVQGEINELKLKRQKEVERKLAEEKAKQEAQAEAQRVADEKAKADELAKQNAEAKVAKYEAVDKTVNNNPPFDPNQPPVPTEKPAPAPVNKKVDASDLLASIIGKPKKQVFQIAITGYVEVEADSMADAMVIANNKKVNELLELRMEQ